MNVQRVTNASIPSPRPISIGLVFSERIVTAASRARCGRLGCSSMISASGLRDAEENRARSADRTRRRRDLA